MKEGREYECGGPRRHGRDKGDGSVDSGRCGGLGLVGERLEKSSQDLGLDDNGLELLDALASDEDGNRLDGTIACVGVLLVGERLDESRCEVDLGEQA